MGLCGNSIPDVITSQPMVILDAPRMKVLVPLLNKWLGGFGEESGAAVTEKQEQLMDAEKKMQQNLADAKGNQEKDRPSMVSFDPSLIDGGLPSNDEQFGQVLQTPNGSVDLRYFDPKTCNFFVQEAPSNHLQTIDPKRPLGFDSIQSIATLAKEKKRWLSPLGRFRKGRR